MDLILTMNNHYQTNLAQPASIYFKNTCKDPDNLSDQLKARAEVLEPVTLVQWLHPDPSGQHMVWYPKPQKKTSESCYI